jgi:formylglycine-generating enzyme required for sulfatase activity
MAPPTTSPLTAARPPLELTPWYGPARGFDFAREVQPVLDRHCVGCHDGRSELCDLRDEELVENYQGRQPGRLDLTRMRDEHRDLNSGRIRYTPAYESLVPYIRRVNVGDDVSMLSPGFYHADTSELIQILQKGHHGVRLDQEDWDRLITWIDLNGPCHGTWGDVFDIPVLDHADRRRMELFELYGGPPDDPESVHEVTVARLMPEPKVGRYAADARDRRSKTEKRKPLDNASNDNDAVAEVNVDIETQDIEVGEGLRLQVVRIPAGRFVMGNAVGLPDERPETQVDIAEPFWISVCEISNQQLRQCLPSHDSGYYTKRHKDRYDDKGMSLRHPKQPALKVSWNEAMEYCRWLSRKTGLSVSLPTEAQWEYACRATSEDDFHYGGRDADFGRFANMADKTFATFGFTGKSLTGMFEIEGGIDYLVAEGVDHADRRFDDGSCMTAFVGERQPNRFGVADMHGNVAEWTLSLYRPYPYEAGDGRNRPNAAGERVVRGGSFLDRPDRCRSAARYSYPSWQKVYNVGFRIVVNQPTLSALSAAE